MSSEEIKLIALFIVDLHLAEGVSQLQLNRKFLKLHNNLLEGFKVILKTFLSLAMPIVMEM